MPVIFIGSREPGGHTNDLPARGGVVDVVFGAPYRLEAKPWPRSKEQVEQASLLLWDRLLATLDHARALTGPRTAGPVAGGRGRARSGHRRH